MLFAGHWEVLNGRSESTTPLVSFPIPEAAPLLRVGPERRWRVHTAASTCQRFCFAFWLGAVVLLQEITLECFPTYPQLWGGSWSSVMLGCNSEGWQEEWGRIQRDWFNLKKGDFLLQFKLIESWTLGSFNSWHGRVSTHQHLWVSRGSKRKQEYFVFLLAPFSTTSSLCCFPPVPCSSAGFCGILRAATLDGTVVTKATCASGLRRTSDGDWRSKASAWICVPKQSLTQWACQLSSSSVCGYLGFLTSW